MPSFFFISLMAGSPWGGSEELWYRTALLAAEQKHKVGCAVYEWPGKKDKMKLLSDAGVRIYYLPNKGRTKKNLLERLRNKLSKFRLRKMVTSLPVNDYDLVIVNQGAFEITTPEWKHFYTRLKKFVLLFHNYKEGEVFRHGKANAIRQWISRAVLNLFASQKIKIVLEEHSAITVKNWETLINPITISIPEEPAPYPELISGNYRMVVLAALDVQRKAQDQLIRALASPKWKERNWTLHLYGEGRDKKLLEELIRELELEQKIFIEGQTGDVKKVLQDAHLVLQLTHIDAMPLSVVEAMAMARPVVASRIGDMPLWVEEGRNGWISRNAQATEIDHTLELAWQQRAYWREMGRESFTIFREKFPGSPEKHFFEILEKAAKN